MLFYWITQELYDLQVSTIKHKRNLTKEKAPNIIDDNAPIVCDVNPYYKSKEKFEENF